MKQSNPKSFRAKLANAGKHVPQNSGIFSNSGAGQKMDPKNYGSDTARKTLKYATGCNHDLKRVKK